MRIARNPLVEVSLLLGGLCLLIGCTTGSREGVDEKFNFFPVARYETSEEPEGYAFDALWPLIQFQRAGDASASRVLPLYAHTDDGEGERFSNVLALYWQTVDEEAPSVRRTLFPLLHYVDTPDEKKTHLWPIYGVRRYGGEHLPERTDSVAYPLFEYDRALDGSRSELGLLSLWKLAAVYRRNRGVTTERRYATDTMLDLLGLFTLFERGATTTGDGRETDLQVARLLDEDELSLVHASSTHGDDGDFESAHLFPLYFSGSTPTEAYRFLLPLYGSQSEGDHYRRRWYLPPLFSHTADLERELSAVDVAWPLIRWSSEGSGAEQESHFRFLPLLWFTTRPDSRVDLVLPLYYHISDPKNDYLHLVPLFGRHREDEGELRRTFVLAPLFIHTEDDRTLLRRTEVLWPLSRFETSASGTLNRVFPLFYYESLEARTHLNLLLLFDRDESDVRSSTVMYPLFSSLVAGGEGTRRSILPVIDWRLLDDDPPEGDSLSFLWPLADFRRDGDDVASWIFPFYWWFDDGAGDSVKHLWPLLGRHRDGSRSTWATLFPLFFTGSDEDDPAYGELGALYPLGYRETGVDRLRHWLFPLWYHSRTAEYESSWVLWPLFSRTADEDRLDWHSLFHLLRYEREPTHEEFSVLYALYRSRIEAERTTRSVAFLFHFEDDAGAKTLRLFHLIPIRWGSSER